jgi:hypothetical protein
MRTYLFIGLSFLTAACTTSDHTAAGTVLEIEGDTGDAVEVGDVVEGDTWADNTDTGSDDQVAACDDTEDYTYPVETWDGIVEMGNQLEMTVSEDSPYWYLEPGYANVFSVDFAAVNECGDDLTVGGFTMYVSTTDVGNTYWYEEATEVEMVDLDTGESFGFGYMGVCNLNGGGCPQSTVVFREGEMGYYGLSIPAGTTRKIGFIPDTRNVSHNDTMRMTIGANQMGVYDEHGEFHVIRYDAVRGYQVAFTTL